MTVQAWLTSSLVRHFPRSPARTARSLSIDAARNERVSFQIGLRQSGGLPQTVHAEVEAPPELNVRVRRVGYVPVAHLNTDTPVDELDGAGHIPGFAPDPLFDEDRLVLPADETHAFYFTVIPGRRNQPGEHRIRVHARPERGRAIRRDVILRVHDVRIRPRRDFRFVHWFYNDALLDYYECNGFDGTYWQVLPAYLRNAAEHGMDTITVPMFTPPTDGVKRPTQLLRVVPLGGGRYRFDWRDVRRYLAVARQCGIRHFMWTHLFSQWGGNHALRIYEGQGENERLLWKADTGATSAVYRNFLSQFLPRLHSFLNDEKLLQSSFFCVSDEPHGQEMKANYQRARNVLRELAPWMKVMDALSELDYGREGITDMPVPTISTALDFVKEGIPCWCYYCCAPRGRYLQRLVDTPLAKIRMNGWLFYRWPIRGFLHWGHNYWYRSQTRELIDPFTELAACCWENSWAYGDPFIVYPGPGGPIDSLRWETFADSLQDYALLQTLRVDRDDLLLADLRDFQRFPRDEKWIRKTRRKLFARIADNGQ